jgi:hypothetical protein
VSLKVTNGNHKKKHKYIKEERIVFKCKLNFTNEGLLKKISCRKFKKINRPSHFIQPSKGNLRSHCGAANHRLTCVSFAVSETHNYDRFSFTCKNNSKKDQVSLQIVGFILYVYFSILAATEVENVSYNHVNFGFIFLIVVVSMTLLQILR